ncbi:putative aspartate aminotransferase, mitochondrial [Trypanosoma rangeli]|uniref:Putative aspartate aminotransferase, mitochondrial n=1 Tax=Trypanosoma rangeli TaxID=5698 RepID=A0A3R7K490_TRYRA|nr:putative aspartate aminotransferase, mitochondrial [Trypanosoma rangeli]RNF00212.1 putative aspartate aminotransferase, mitochondrial [Trypanosoma rangeli]|eukprot:RNF00212.1 putative aspartate aminotransferase, mitochondrial [Trypanosoma rangeli]
MGLCCGRSAMPVVDDRGRKHRALHPKVSVTPMPTVEFDIIAPEDAGDLTLNMMRRGSSGGAFFMNASLHTVSEFSFTMADCKGQSLSGTLRDDAARSFLTNGMNEVLPDHVKGFLSSICEVTHAEPPNTLEDSFFETSISTLNQTRGHRYRIGGSSAAKLTAEEKLYIDKAHSTEERIARLVDLEQMSRQDIYGVWKMNNTMMFLGWKGALPTLRRLRKGSQSRKRNSAREVLVIHAKDIDLQLEDDKRRENGAGFQGVLGRRCEGDEQEVMFSPSEALETTTRSKTVAEHYQLLALTAREISITASVQAQVVHDTWDFLSLPEASTHLNTGNVFFRFVCSPVRHLGTDSLELINTFINESSFADEVQENNVPKIHIFSPEEQNKYVSILVKTMYLLPGVRLSHLDADLLASLDYQRNCQPGNNKFESPEDIHTFRTVKTVIRFVFSITIQMKVSAITDSVALQKFRDVDGMVPAKVLLLERTKRNIHKMDSTVKVRSVLLYYPVNAGLLVTNVTIVLNTSLPTVVSSLMQTFGTQGATEAAQTAKQTRRYLIHRFGDSRS